MPQTGALDDVTRAYTPTKIPLESLESQRAERVRVPRFVWTLKVKKIVSFLLFNFRIQTLLVSCRNYRMPASDEMWHLSHCESRRVELLGGSASAFRRQRRFVLRWVSVEIRNTVKYDRVGRVSSCWLPHVVTRAQDKDRERILCLFFAISCTTVPR